MSLKNKSSDLSRTKSLTTSGPLYSSTPFIDPSSSQPRNLSNTSVNKDVSAEILAAATTTDNQDVTVVTTSNGHGHLIEPEIGKAPLSAGLSPIIPSGGLGINMCTAAGKDIRSVQQSADNLPSVSSSSPYPFPTPDCIKNFKMDKYKSILTSLTILKSISLLKEQASLGSGGERKKRVPAPNRVPKLGKDVRPAKVAKEFQFTEAMFKTSNTEAFIHVTHFLFTLLDNVKAQEMFRLCWPIYEKKEESLYRRAALTWLTEIINEHPKFFEGKVTVGQLQGLIVNPYGDRFIRLLHAFVNLVMLHITSQQDTIPDKDGMQDVLIYKPKFSKNPEITKRQAKCIQARTHELESLTKACAKTYINNKVILARITSKVNTLNSRMERKLNQRTILMAKCIQQNPSDFPDDAAELLQSHESYFAEAFQKCPSFNWEAARKIPPHPLNTRMDEKWKGCIKSLDEKAEKMYEYFSNHSRLWAILNALHQQNTVELDLAKLFYNLNSGMQQNLRLNDFFVNVAQILNEFHQHLESEKISDDLQSRVNRLNSKMDMIRHSYQKIQEIEIPDVQRLKKQVEFDIKRLNMELEDIDWSKYSGLDDTPLSSIFSFSPPRVVDVTKKTGLTPALSSYLTFGESLNYSAQSMKRGVGNETVTSQSSWKGRGAMNSTMYSQNIQQKDIPTESKQNVGHFTSMDNCDSPVSHLSRTVSKENYLVRTSRNSKRTLTSTQTTIIEDSELGECNEIINVKSISVIHHPDSSSERFSSSSLNFSIVDSEVPNASSRRPSSAQERYQRIIDAIDSPAKSVSPASRSFNRKSLDNITMRDKSRSANQSLNESASTSLLEDLESKLGILDISCSYADFLSLSKEDSF